MSTYPRLNFPLYTFRIRTEGTTERIWDEVRRQWLVLTPEEWVRRHTVRWLMEEHGVPGQLVVQEYPVCIQGQPQRADVVLFGRNADPLMLIECKEPRVAVDEKVYAQAVRYNSAVGAPYIMITNGIRHYIFCRGEEGAYMPVEAFPSLAACGR